MKTMNDKTELNWGMILLLLTNAFFWYSVWQWGFFSHNIVLAIWSVLMILCGVYLLGQIRFPHDSPTEFKGKLQGNHWDF